MIFFVKNHIKVICLTVVSIIIIGLVFFIQHNKWNKYYKNTQYRAPASIIVTAARLFAIPGIALDLGCGAGNETVYLLNDGWQVWAIDSEPRAFKWLLSRNDIPKNVPLHTVTAQLESLDWAELPIVDFVCASNILPFCTPETFKKIWHNIISKIKPQGRFAGHFFGINYQGFPEKDKKKMMFLTKEQVLSLFDDFEIELFKEIENDSQSGTGMAIHAHIFEVAARKKEK